jgi:phosphohistidine swiveling domain-containing protein
MPPWAVLTERGGMTSHAAVIARGWACPAWWAPRTCGWTAATRILSRATAASSAKAT